MLRNVVWPSTKASRMIPWLTGDIAMSSNTRPALEMTVSPLLCPYRGNPRRPPSHPRPPPTPPSPPPPSRVCSSYTCGHLHPHHANQSQVVVVKRGGRRIRGVQSSWCVCVLERLDRVGGGDTEMGVVCLGVSCVHFACGCRVCP